jgi:hypothetical protein
MHEERYREKAKSFTRRDFLRRLTAGIITAEMLELGLEETEAAPRKYRFEKRVLGRTGLKVTPVNVGTVPAPSPQVISYALDVGINYIDTAACYAGGNAERNIGVVMRRRRKEVILATKWHTHRGVRKEQLLRSLQVSLERLQTNHVDIIQVHDVKSLAQVNNRALFEAFEEAKRRGWVRFLGATCHTSGRGIEAMKWVVQSGKFDVILVKYNFVEMRDLDELLKLAKRKNVGVVAMKTLGGARHANLRQFTRREKEAFPRAAMRWVISNPNVSCLVITMKSLKDVDKYAGAVGQPLTAEDERLLEKYARLVGNEHCRWCDECLPCPEGIAIPEILRYIMYYEHYGLERMGMEAYAALGPARWADRCTACGECEARCPYGIRIIESLRRSHTLLA